MDWNDKFRSEPHDYTAMVEGDFGPFQGSDFFQSAMEAIGNHLAFRLVGHLSVSLGRLESPIEAAMFFALYYRALDSHSDVRSIPEEADGFKHVTHIRIIPQQQIDDYRVDFLLTFSGETWGRKAKSRSDPLKRVRVQLVVECDGHDFHERTKEQASRDRERDRSLQAKGYEVHRYTGADIWESPSGCAHSAIDRLLEKAREAADLVP